MRGPSLCPTISDVDPCGAEARARVKGDLVFAAGGALVGLAAEFAGRDRLAEFALRFANEAIRDAEQVAADCPRYRGRETAAPTEYTAWVTV